MILTLIGTELMVSEGSKVSSEDRHQLPPRLRLRSEHQLLLARLRGLEVPEGKPGSCLRGQTEAGRSSAENYENVMGS